MGLQAQWCVCALRLLVHTSLIWIGGHFPVDNFLSYGRMLTLHYHYYILICILELIILLLTVLFWLMNDDEGQRDKCDFSEAHL